MAKLKQGGSTKKQMDYAKKRIFTTGKNKQQLALEAGFSRAVSATPKSKIEDTPGFKNAVSKLAVKSNNLALSILEEFDKRGVRGFTNKELMMALDSIGRAWDRFTAPPKHHKKIDPEYDNGKNPLRTIILQTVNKQTIANPGEIKDAVVNDGEVVEDKVVDNVEGGDDDEF